VVCAGDASYGATRVRDSRLSVEQLARQQALTRRYATAFLRRHLARDRRFARFLAPADAAAEGTDVELTARSRRAGAR
jgi:predicted metallo-beta-lactamase superfamily hydrolase